MGRRRPSLTSWEGTAYRATTYDVPLWVRPNRRPGRWNFARELSAQYLCLDVDAPFAELIRNEQLRTERDAAMLRVSLWEVRLFESAIAEKARAAGVERVAFDRSGYRYHGRIKALADAAREGGLQF